jgi:hypothetical protein
VFPECFVAARDDILPNGCIVNCDLILRSPLLAGVSNGEGGPTLRDAAKTPILRMRT